MLTDEDFTILNALYLKKMATAATVAEVIGLPAERVVERLAAAADAQWVLDMPDGAMLLPAGTEKVLAYYAATYTPLRAQPELPAWYAAFEVINAKFIAQVSEWQQTQGDEKAEQRLLRTAQRLVRDIGALVPGIPRYANYVRRFEHGIEQVDRGQHDFVCKPTIDSVHNIWFEFHEDILTVLGRPRDTT